MFSLSSTTYGCSWLWRCGCAFSGRLVQTPESWRNVRRFLQYVAGDTMDRLL
jgi:hypothetical protein